MEILLAILIGLLVWFLANLFFASGIALILGIIAAVLVLMNNSGWRR